MSSPSPAPDQPQWVEGLRESAFPARCLNCGAFPTIRTRVMYSLGCYLLRRWCWRCGVEELERAI